MLEIAVCDDDIADLECAVNMLHKIFTGTQGPVGRDGRQSVLG